MANKTEVLMGTTLTNVGLILTTTKTTEPDYWRHFGSLQYLEVVYLTIITVLGTIGNMTVMFSIALERRVHAHGNIFIINLAVADLIVSAIIVPTVIANVIAKSNAVDAVFCDVIGFLVTSTCTCSLCNLMFIAVNRYWAVVRPSTYQKVFTRKRVYYLVGFTWLWSLLLVSPTVLGWGGLRYDGKMMICSWDDSVAPSYTYFITFIAIFLPLCIIAFCYFRLFATVRSSGRWVRSLSVGSGISHNSEQHRRSMEKERSLLRTLLTTVLMFCVCWVPFGACILINPTGTPKHAKKVFGWLALTNSCVNFIIYGAMNPVFRRGYHNLFIFIFRCKRTQLFSSTGLHGSFSDSFRTIKQGAKRKNDTIAQISRSEINRENSRNEIFANNRTALQASQMTQTTMWVKDSPTTQNADVVTAAIDQTSIQKSSAVHETFESGDEKISSVVSSKHFNCADFITTDEHDPKWRQKRNSAMLLQIEMNDNSDEEFIRDQNDRYSRRTVSDIGVKMDRNTEIQTPFSLDEKFKQ